MIVNDYFIKKTIQSATGQQYPINTIYCVGQNYVKHIEELKSVNTGKPLIFSKPVTSVIFEGSLIDLPELSHDVHHEIELYIHIGKSGKFIDQEHSADYIDGYGLALDLTLRDLQAEAKKNGAPWLIAKGFDTSCPMSSLYPFSKDDDKINLQKLEFYLEKNHTVVQHGNTSLMIYPVDFLISYISKWFTLLPGDVILTGTPEGVGPIRKGDTLCFWSESIKKTVFNVKK